MTQPPPCCSAAVIHPSTVAIVVPCLMLGVIRRPYGSSGGMVSANVFVESTPETPRPLLYPHAATISSEPASYDPNGYAKDVTGKPHPSSVLRSVQTSIRASAVFSFLTLT